MRLLVAGVEFFRVQDSVAFKNGENNDSRLRRAIHYPVISDNAALMHTLARLSFIHRYIFSVCNEYSRLFRIIFLSNQRYNQNSLIPGRGCAA